MATAQAGAACEETVDRIPVKYTWREQRTAACRLIKCGTSATAKKVDYPLQFFRLAKDIAQKVRHEFETWTLLRNRFQIAYRLSFLQFAHLPCQAFSGSFFRQAEHSMAERWARWECC